MASQQWDEPAVEHSLLRLHMVIEECGLRRGGGATSTCTAWPPGPTPPKAADVRQYGAWLPPLFIPPSHKWTSRAGSRFTDGHLEGNGEMKVQPLKSKTFTSNTNKLCDFDGWKLKTSKISFLLMQPLSFSKPKNYFSVKQDCTFILMWAFILVLYYWKMSKNPKQDLEIKSTLDLRIADSEPCEDNGCLCLWSEKYVLRFWVH